MRLTLRTLLAYLDDTLEPAQAKSIGQKIAESPTAQEIIARIREVVRRRRITTPPLTGPGAKLDVNMVAEYIDSTLESEDLAELEETCLNSDVYLAEVAACHQILSVVLSEPSKVPPTAKQRMYALVRGPESIPYRKAARPAAESASAADLSHDDAEDTLLMGLPFLRGQPASVRWLVPVGGLLVFLASVLAAIWLALPPTATKPADDGNADPRVAQNQPPKIAPPATPPVSRPKDESKPPSDGQPAAGDASTPKDTTSKPGDEPMPKPADPAPPKTRPTDSGQSEGGADTPKVDSPPVDAKPAPIGERKIVGKYVSPANVEPSILLQRGNEQAPWQRLSHNANVATEDELVSLPGYRSQIDLNGGVGLTLWGTMPGDGSPAALYESAATLHDRTDVDVELTLLRGRIGLANLKPAGGIAKARVRFNDEAWEITMEPESEVALELSGTPSFDFDTDPAKAAAPQAVLGLFVLKGQINLKVRLQNHLMREPRGPALFFWSNVAGPAPGPQPMERLPAWASKAVRGSQPKMIQALDNLSLRLRGKSPVDLTLAEMVKDADSANQRLGVYCLGAIADLPNLLGELANEHSPESRRAAIDILRHYIGQQAANGGKLYRALEKKYYAAPAEVIMHLLHGFSQEMRSKPELFDYLIDNLRSDNLPIRQLAFMHLALMPETREFGKQIPFDPAGGVDQRDAAHIRWKEAIPDGKVPSKDGPPPAAGTKKPMT